MTQLSKAPTTTAQQDLISAGQREVNLLWENTQSRLALIIIVAFNLVIFLVIGWALWRLTTEVDGDSSLVLAVLALISTALTLLYGLTNLVVGFYFGRTNHQRTGGIGGEDIERSR
jgi:hypothetical protein